MRILLSALLTLSLLGCAAAEEPAVTEAPTTEVNPAPGSEEATPTEQEAEDSETEPASETEIDPEQSAADAEAEASAKPKPSSTRTQAEESAEPTEEASQPAAPKPTSSQDGYTLAQVAEKNSQSACWVAIDGMVYDLTDWIRSHPGGRAAIISLCGTDGTSGFLSQHGGQSRPSATLDQYLLGPLVG